MNKKYDDVICFWVSALSLIGVFLLLCTVLFGSLYIVDEQRCKQYAKLYDVNVEHSLFMECHVEYEGVYVPASIFKKLLFLNNVTIGYL